MRSTFSKLKNKVLPGIGAAAVALATPVSAWAVQIKDNLNPEEIGGKLLDILFIVATVLGGGLIIWGAIQFGMSIAQENPDQRSRALLQVIAGAIVVSIQWVLKALGVIA